ncbi:aminoglycoside phosphotransferase, partial [Apodospora peruviana]
MNHEYFEERMTLVKEILKNHDLEHTSITPLEYDENCPFPYNNFLYKITLAEPAKPQSFFVHANKACTSLPPEEGVRSLVIRLSNPRAEGLNQTNRVQNEVAALHLARCGDDHNPLSKVFPAVYDWAPPLHSDASPAIGWVLMEFKPGVALDQHFGTLSDKDSDKKAAIISQIADVFSLIQSAPLPDGVKYYGGLTISGDGSGAIVSGQMTTLAGGPWPSYGSFWRAKLAAQLRDSDESSVLQGWRGEHGIREPELVLVHGDLTMNNILFDPDTDKITGVVDFDFASVGHPCQEFFSSLREVGGNVSSEETTEGTLWEDALAARGILRPATIQGMGSLKLIGRLEELLCPFRLAHPIFIARQTAGQIMEGRAKAEEELVHCLVAL